MKYFLFILVLTSLLSWQCKNKKNDAVEPAFENGIMINFNGSGCGWHIRLDEADENGRRYLEPENLDAFNFALVDSQRVAVRYKVRTDLHSICMSGKIVDLTDIKVR